MHGRGGESVSNAGITLDGEPRSAPGAFPAEADALDSQFGNDIVLAVVFRGVVHAQARNSERSRIQNSGRDHAVPGDVHVLRHVVVQYAESRQVLRRKAILTAYGVAANQTVSPIEDPIDAQRALVRYVMVIADIVVIVRIHSTTHDRRLAHHRHSHTIHQVGHRHVFAEHDDANRIQQVRRNLVVRKRIPNDLRIRRAHRL